LSRAKKPDFLDGVIREAEQEQEREAKRRQAQASQRTRNELAISKKRVRELEADLAHMQDVRDILDQLEGNPLDPFSFSAKEKTSRKPEAIAVQMLSDLHFEEVVDPEEINGKNEFNLAIAADSMQRLAIGTSWLLELARERGGIGYQIRELFLPCLGDVITNYLRAEDIAGNFLTPYEAVIFAEEQLVGYVRHVLDRCPWIERVYMPFVAGNHDRMSWEKRTPFRGRQKMSLAVMLAHGVSRELRDDKRVTVELSKSEHHYTDVYGHRIRGMHGDRFSYNSGAGGIYVPARRHIAGLNKSMKAHCTLFGHWHQSKEDDNWVSNGSLIGPNTYSIGKGLDEEPPSQTFLLFDKERGKRLCTPVHCRERVEWS
jgi:predicted phosphodiesterase